MTMTRPEITLQMIQNDVAEAELGGERQLSPTTEDWELAQKWEDFLWKEAPNGWTRCTMCGYEKPRGAACGEPCV